MALLDRSRISQLLPTVKCSICNNAVALDTLGDHVCKKPASVPLVPRSAPAASITSNSRPPPSKSPNQPPNPRSSSISSRQAPVKGNTGEPVRPMASINTRLASRVRSSERVRSPLASQEPIVAPSISPPQAPRPLPGRSLTPQQQVSSPRTAGRGIHPPPHSAASATAPRPAPSAPFAAAPRSAASAPAPRPAPSASLADAPRSAASASAPRTPPTTSLASGLPPPRSAPSAPAPHSPPAASLNAGLPPPRSAAPAPAPRTPPTASIAAGPLPSSAPLPRTAGAAFPDFRVDTKTGGEAGMAGVGRRGFAVAASNGMFVAHSGMGPGINHQHLHGHMYAMPSPQRPSPTGMDPRASNNAAYRGGGSPSGSGFGQPDVAGHVPSPIGRRVPKLDINVTKSVPPRGPPPALSPSGYSSNSHSPPLPRSPELNSRSPSPRDARRQPSLDKKMHQYHQQQQQQQQQFRHRPPEMNLNDRKHAGTTAVMPSPKQPPPAPSPLSSGSDYPPSPTPSDGVRYTNTNNINNTNTTNALPSRQASHRMRRERQPTQQSSDTESEYEGLAYAEREILLDSPEQEHGDNAGDGGAGRQRPSLVSLVLAHHGTGSASNSGNNSNSASDTVASPLSMSSTSDRDRALLRGGSEMSSSLSSVPKHDRALLHKLTADGGSETASLATSRHHDQRYHVGNAQRDAAGGAPSRNGSGSDKGKDKKRESDLSISALDRTMQSVLLRDNSSSSSSSKAPSAASASPSPPPKASRALPRQNDKSESPPGSVGARSAKGSPPTSDNPLPALGMSKRLPPPRSASISSASVPKTGTAHAATGRTNGVALADPVKTTTETAAAAKPSKVCVKCEKRVEDGRWVQVERRAILCEVCWKDMYLPKCRRCKLPIERHAVSSSDGQLKGKYHRHCFNCYQCHKPFPDKSFYVYDGKPLCAYHYHEANDSLCAAATCGQPIEGPCAVSHAGDRYHPEHIICEHAGPGPRCPERLVDYWEVDGRMLCDRHAKEAMRGSSAWGEGEERDRALEEADAEERRTGRGQKRRTRFIDLAGNGAAP